jgi:outer membrane protein OmpA-like peptidoglycan-associated protein
MSFGKNPLVFVDQATTPSSRHEVIADQLSLDLMGSLALGDWVDIGLAWPIFLLNRGGTGFLSGILEPIPSAAQGDLRLTTKVRVLNRKGRENGFGLAADVMFVLPTGNPNGFVSDFFAFEPLVIADFKYEGFLVALNVGARLRAKQENFVFLDVTHEFLWRAAAGYEILADELEVMAELHGASSFLLDRQNDLQPALEQAKNHTQVEGVVAGRYTIKDIGLFFSLGGGSGWAAGYGNTKFRLFAGLGYAVPVNRDHDGDLIPDEGDTCPAEPEDKDGFQDEDGCPEPDNDQDALNDELDRCPNDVEDKDGFDDTDGCPEADNDGDGLEDPQDKCPLEAEDKDNHQDEDGCLDPDNDRDQIRDPDDQCPDQPENLNGFQDSDGCADETTARIEADQIVLKGKVSFDPGKPTLTGESYPGLKDVAAMLKSHPELKAIRIEAHTDDRGSDKQNLKLSGERAVAVKQFLADEGVEADRLTTTGLGRSQKLAEGKGPEVQEQNRRIVFRILASP